MSAETFMKRTVFACLTAFGFAVTFITGVRILDGMTERDIVRERCAAIAERTTSQTEYANGICWVNINSNTNLAPNWQPEEWLH